MISTASVMSQESSPPTKRQKTVAMEKDSLADGEGDALTKGCQKSMNEMDTAYFSCYADMEAHEGMLSDAVRTNAYRSAILKNYPEFYRKVVMDVGSGTGILSVFCCQAGARKVYAVEASSMAPEISKVATENGYADRITVINSRLEDIEELPEKVDVIVSEWMGRNLLYESMLPSVLIARDKFLKKGGLLFPNKARLFIAPFSDEEYDKRIEEWKQMTSQYKVSMDCLVSRLRKNIASEVIAKSLLAENIVAREQEVTSLDLDTVTVEDTLEVKSSFSFQCFGHNRVHGFVTWFTVDFPGGSSISTSPYHEQTHWNQSEFYLEEPFQVEQDTRIQGQVRMTPNKDKSRHLDVELSYQVDDGPSIEKKYTMT